MTSNPQVGALLAAMATAPRIDFGIVAAGEMRGVHDRTARSPRIAARRLSGQAGPAHWRRSTGRASHAITEAAPSRISSSFIRSSTAPFRASPNSRAWRRRALAQHRGYGVVLERLSQRRGGRFWRTSRQGGRTRADFGCIRHDARLLRPFRSGLDALPWIECARRHLGEALA